MTIHENLKLQLLSESTKCRHLKPSQILSKEMFKAAKDLKNHPDIIVRRADKSSLFVGMNRAEYKAKLDQIVSDSAKFKI